MNKPNWVTTTKEAKEKYRQLRLEEAAPRMFELLKMAATANTRAQIWEWSDTKAEARALITWIERG